jgi:virulence-associated protein VagC
MNKIPDGFEIHGKQVSIVVGKDRIILVPADLQSIATLSANLNNRDVAMSMFAAGVTVLMQADTEGLKARVKALYDTVVKNEKSR